MRKSFDFALVVLLVVFPLSIQAADNPFFVSFDSVAPVLQDEDTVVFDGIRVDGFNFNSSRDALRLEYNFDYSTLNFVLNRNIVRVYSNIGVFHEEHMAKDVSVVQPNFTVGNTVFSMGDLTYDITITNGDAATLDMNLEPGHVISFYISEPSAAYATELSGSNSRVGFNGVAGAGVISGSYPVLTSGSYKLSIRPTSSSSLALKLRVFNANNGKLAELFNNNTLSLKFENNIRDYAKFKVRLLAGQVLSLPQPANAKIGFKLVDSLGRAQATSTGLALAYPAVVTGDYYLFIYNDDGHGGSYSGTVKINSSQALLQAGPMLEGDMTNFRYDYGVSPAQ